MTAFRLLPDERAARRVDLRRLARASREDEPAAETVELRGLAGDRPRRRSPFALHYSATSPSPPAGEDRGGGARLPPPSPPAVESWDGGDPTAQPPHVFITHTAPPPSFAVPYPVLDIAPPAVEPAQPFPAAPPLPPDPGAAFAPPPWEQPPPTSSPWPPGDGGAGDQPDADVLYSVVTPLPGVPEAAAADGAPPWDEMPFPGAAPAPAPLPGIDAMTIQPRPAPARQPVPMPELPRSPRFDELSGGPAPAAPLDPEVAKVLTALGLIATYIAICLAPLAVVSIDGPTIRRPFLVEFSVGLGYVGLSMMVLQFTLVSRIKWLARP